MVGIHKLDTAEYWFRKLVQTAQSANEQEAAYIGLKALYRKKGNTDSVAKYAELCYELRDTVYFQNDAETIHQLQAIYDYSRHQQNSMRQTIVIKKQKERIKTMIILFCFVLLLAYFLIIYIRRKKNEEIRNINTQYSFDLLQYQKAKKELELLYHNIEKNAQNIVNLRKRLLKKLFDENGGAKDFDKKIYLL